MATELDNQKKNIVTIIKLMRTATKKMVQPAASSIIKQYGRDPFLILISCILSLRTKDSVSLPASQRLFSHAQTAEKLLCLSPKTIEQLIYPTGFYRQKTKQILKLCTILIEKYSGNPPRTRDELILLPGVGPKTASLVLSEGFGIPAICVDTHVHRISNRLGLVKTISPAQTETELEKIVPQKYWAELNRLMVMWGQNICVPISPKCSICPLRSLCPQVGVTKHR
ncbi:MAG TPA: endonuclease III [Candidatus Babeliales bacterium]|nr:endonuclease III [Candidatus Babeliales bacterium]